MASRERLSLALHAACAAQFPDLISHRWGISGEVFELDLPTRTVTLRDGSVLPYDLLVAADGVRSRIRTLLAEQNALLVSQVPAEMGFATKSFTSALLPAPPGVDAHAWRAGLHIFQPDRERRFMLGQPNPDGSLNCMLFLSRAQWEAFRSGSDVAARSPVTHTHISTPRFISPQEPAAFPQCARCAEAPFFPPVSRATGGAP